MVLKRCTIVITLWCIVGFTGVGHAQSDQPGRPPWKRVDLVDHTGDLSFLDDGRPCNFDPQQLFCGVAYTGGGLIESSPGGHYVYVRRGLKRENEPANLPVVPWSTWPEGCDSAIGVIDLKTCRLIRTIRIRPGRGGGHLDRDDDIAFEASDKFLTVRYDDYTTDIYRAPDFKQRLTLPYRATLLGEIPGRRLVACAEFRGSHHWDYVVLADEGTEFREVVRRDPGEWGVKLLGDLNLNPPGGWQLLYADDQVFAVLYPAVSGKTGAKPPTVEAYRFAGGPPAVNELPPDARDIRVNLDAEGHLACSWTVHDKSVTSPLTFPKAARREYCETCRHAPREATHWIDAQGNLIRLSDRHVCSYDRYTLRKDGGRYDFLPCQSETYAWASPRGHDLVLPGSLNPKQNPESTGKTGGPGCFRNGYDPVLAVVDLDLCRIVRFIRSSSESVQRGAEVRFSPDGSLLFFGGAKEIYAAPDFRKIAVETNGVALLGRDFGFPGYGPMDMTTTGRNGEVFFGWPGYAWSGVLLRRAGSKAELTLIPARLLTVGDSKYQHGTRLLYTDDSVAVYLASDYREEFGGKPPAVVTVLYGAKQPKAAVSEIPYGASAVSVKRTKDGSLVCRYQAGGKQVVKRLAPGASTPHTEPQQADK